MAQPDPVVVREIPLVEKIIQDETWLEGERRGGPVSPNDPVVRENVCQVILRIGARLREMLEEQLAAYPGPAMLPVSPEQHDRAA